MKTRVLVWRARRRADRPGIVAGPAEQVDHLPSLMPEHFAGGSGRFLRSRARAGHAAALRASNSAGVGEV